MINNGTYIGIDPGITGALAAISSSREIADCVDMPLVTARGGKNQVDGRGVARWLEQYPGATVVLERVASRPGQGVASVFSFGYSAGVVYGVATALGHPVVFATPQQWKRAFGLLGADKDYSRTIATERLPDASRYLTRKKDHGRADALLLALYGLEAAQATGRTSA